jgi:hypothetical protein
MIIHPSSRFTRLPFLLALAFAAVLPLEAADGQRGHNNAVTVLYEGPPLDEEDWTIKSGPVSPDNQKAGALGGTCSMVPSDVSMMTGSVRERVTFEAENIGLGVWKMTWTETLSGSALNGDEWHEEMRIEFSGTTTDGKPPRPNSSLPVPSNVTSDALDLSDLFVLQPPGGDIAASSHVHWVLRRQIPPVATDNPPDYFPVVLFGGYIVNLHEQLAGQFGCDPL